MIQPLSPTKHQIDIRFANMKLMKQQILDIRQRRENIPKVPPARIISSFQDLYKRKSNEIKKRMLLKRIKQKEKEYKKIEEELYKYKQKYEDKQKSFKQKEHILRILTEKLQSQYEKTKILFRDVAVNRSITIGVKKLYYYRIAQIIFNDNARRLFRVLDNTALQPQQNSNKHEEQMSICIGYLGLLISLVGEISGGRIWFDFSFKGSRSTLKLNDGCTIVLRPKQSRFKDGISVLIQQLYQILHDTLGQKVKKTSNLYQICQQLSKFIMG